jgi:hypothetical protein
MLKYNRADIEWMEARLGASLDEELGEHQTGDVRDESDLLRPDPDVVEKLRAMLGDAAPDGVRGETPQEVAALVHALGGICERRDRGLRGLRRRARAAAPSRLEASSLPR